MYRLPASTAFFGKVRAVMDEGVGFVLIDRLPVEEMSEEEAKTIYGSCRS